MDNNDNNNSPVEIRVINATKGKGLFARREIKQDEILFEEEPQVIQIHSFLQEIPVRVCNHCMCFVGPLEEQFQFLARAVGYSFDSRFREVIERGRPYEPELPIAVECPHCKEVYCGSKCKTKAWNSYHEVLCPSTPQLEAFYRENAKSIQTYHLAMVIKLIGMIIQESKKRGIDEALKVVIGNYRKPRASEVILTKIGEDSSGCQEFFDDNLRQYFTAIQGLIPGMMQYPPLTESRLFDELVGMLFINSAQIEIFSPLHKYFARGWRGIEYFIPFLDKINTKYDGIPQADGSALYSWYSMINHSCDPNILTREGREDELMRTEEGRNANCKVIARRGIQPGEEILTSYIHPQTPKHQRKKDLQQYLFQCDCPRCTQPECAVCWKIAPKVCGKCRKVRITGRSCLD